MSIVRVFGVVALACALAACSGNAGTPPVSPPQAARAVAPSPSVYVVETCSRTAVPCPGKGGFVEVLGGATIVKGLNDPADVAVDAEGNAWIVNPTSSQAGFVSIFAPGSVAPQRTIRIGHFAPHWIATGGSGDVVAVGNYHYKCCQILGAASLFDASSSQLLRRLPNVGSFPGSPVFDAKGNLYVANFDDFPGWISEYAASASAPVRLIQKGIGFPVGLAVDASGNLFVLNLLFDKSYDVTEYSPGSGAVKRTITKGLANTRAIAVDSQGYVYAANTGTQASSSITVYAPGQTAVSRTIRSGVFNPVALAFDRSGNLYVANGPAHAVNTVAVYAPSGSVPMQTYRLQQDATRIAIAPR